MNLQTVVKATAEAAAAQVADATAELEQRVADLEALVLRQSKLIQQLYETRLGSSQKLEAAALLRDGIDERTAKGIAHAVEIAENEAWSEIEDAWNAPDGEAQAAARAGGGS